MLNILYFARLREDLGSDQEDLALPEGITTTAELRDLLMTRGEQWQQALSTAGLLVAVNQDVSDWSSKLKGDEEVAFFPPVTGG